MKKGVRDVFLSIVLIVIGAYTFFESASFPDIAAHFPRRISLILILLALTLMASGIFQVRKKPGKEKTTGPYSNVFFLAIFIAVYILILEWGGYLLSTVGLVFAVMSILGYKNKIKALLVALISVAASFVLFRFLLGVPLPLGIFMES